MCQAKLADFGWCAELSESQERLTFCRLACLPEVKLGNCLKTGYMVVMHQNYIKYHKVTFFGGENMEKTWHLYLDKPGLGDTCW